jgi:glycosyltransferase involved in cell wall biosynthesis
MIGQRGVPATFGGVERHVEEIGARLVDRGHDVTVFVRPNYTENPLSEYRGMRVQSVRTIGTKHLDAIVHSAASTMSAAGRYDIVHYHAQGPGVPAVIPRYLSRSRVVQTIHGLDSQRSKWGGAAQRMLSAAEWMSAKVPDATIVVSRALADHYRAEYDRDTWVIPNGVVTPTRRTAMEITERFGLLGGDYALFVGRFVPEKAPDLLMEAFSNVDTDARLLLAGSSSFTDEYVGRLDVLASRDPRIIMPGYVYGDVLDELYTNAAVFVLPSNLEGLPLTLLEAASYDTPLIASDIPPHTEVITDPGPGHRLFPSGDRDALTDAISDALKNQDEEGPPAAEFGQVVRERFTWDSATEATERVYESVLDR